MERNLVLLCFIIRLRNVVLCLAENCTQLWDTSIIYAWEACFLFVVYFHWRIGGTCYSLNTFVYIVGYYLKRDCLLKMSPFLLQICPKLFYFIHEYACHRAERSAITGKLAKNINDRGRTAAPLSAPPSSRLPLHACYRHQNQTLDRKVGEKVLRWHPLKYLLIPI